jgi:hypothetical protein
MSDIKVLPRFLEQVHCQLTYYERTYSGSLGKGDLGDFLKQSTLVIAWDEGAVLGLGSLTRVPQLGRGCYGIIQNFYVENVGSVSRRRQICDEMLQHVITAGLDSFMCRLEVCLVGRPKLIKSSFLKEGFKAKGQLHYVELHP